MCVYCENYKKITSELKLGDVFMVSPAMYTKIGDGTSYIIPTNFCPACGQKLSIKKNPEIESEAGLKNDIVPYPVGGMIYYVETSSESDDAWISNKPIQYIDKEGYHCGWGLATLCFKFSDLGEVYFFSREEAQGNLSMAMQSKKCESFQEEYGKTVCYGTKEREECSCDGDRRKCNFYPTYRNGEINK